MATAGGMAADEEAMKELVTKIEDELWHPLTDPIKESTLEYYEQNKDKVVILNGNTLKQTH